MNFFIDLKIKPDAEMRENLLFNKIYAKLHKALSTMQSNDIGVSFPKYRIKLGDTIRIHGSQDRLNVLQGMAWLGGLSGYCDVSECLPVPNGVKHRVISRKQCNMTEAKLRRLQKRGSITAEASKEYKAKMFTQGLDNPYLELESASNGHKHRRYIQFSELVDDQVKGEFDQFGLSKKATIPWF